MERFPQQAYDILSGSTEREGDRISNLVPPPPPPPPGLSPVFHEPYDKRISSYSLTLCPALPVILVLSPVIRNSACVGPLSDIATLPPLPPLTYLV